MTQRTCSSCGALVALADERCRACGSDPDLRLLELGTLAGRRRQGPTHPHPGGWRRWAPVAAGVAAVWVFLALTGGGSGDEREPPVDEVARPPTSSPADATTTTDRPARTSSTTSVVPGAPLLGEPSALQLVVVSGTSRVVDLDTGGVTNVRARVLATTAVGLLVDDRDGIAVWSPPFDGSIARRVLAETPETVVEQVWVVEAGTRVWTVERPYAPATPAPLATATLVDLDGRALGLFDLPSEVWVVGATDHGLVLSGPGGVYLVDAIGNSRRISTGDVGGVVGDRIYASNCDEELRCHLEVMDGRGELLALEPSLDGYVGWALAAPDGRVAAVEYRDHLGAPNRVTVDGVEVFEDPSPNPIPGAVGLGSIAWSPDGRWLAVATLDGVHFVDTLGGSGERVADVGHVDQGAVLFLLSTAR